MPRSLRTRLSRPVPAVVAVTALALVARLWALGWRVFHQDEGRVGGWILHYMETGAWEYRPIIHGPFIPHVNGVLFSWFGPSDFLARFPMAVVGGLLPLTALLLRERLRDSEVVALSVFLAANPLLLYYSRFMRNDVLLAAFTFAAVAFAVRAYDADRPSFLVPAGLTLALAFTTKENALAYPISWVGAGLLVVDARILLERERGESALGAAGERLRNVGRRRALAFVAAALGGFLVFAGTFVAFYAPLPVTSLTDALGGATVGVWEKLGTWLDGGMRDHAYIPYFIYYTKVLAYTSLPLVVFAVAGFLADRYAAADTREFVAFCFFWGLSGLFGYPIITDIAAPWSGLNMVVPLAVPAAVGLAGLWRLVRRAYARTDRVGTVGFALGVGALVLAASITGGVAAETSYLDPQSPDIGGDGVMVQYAQPAGEMQPVLRDIERVAPANEGTDVLYYGDLLSDEGVWVEEPPPAWFDRLPLPWYTERANATTGDTTNASVACEANAPVIVALEAGQGDPQLVAGDIGECLRERGYTEVVYQQYQSNRPLHFFLAPGVAE